MSRYEFFRRRIAPIAFFLAIGLIAKDSCDKQQRTHTTVELELGDARSKVRAIDVEVWVGDRAVARAHRGALPGEALPRPRIDLALPEDDGELRIDIDLAGDLRHVTRRFHAVEGSTMAVDLRRDLGD